LFQIVNRLGFANALAQKCRNFADGFFKKPHMLQFKTPDLVFITVLQVKEKLIMVIFGNMKNLKINLVI
jgi:hypothetical protein